MGVLSGGLINSRRLVFFYGFIEDIIYIKLKYKLSPNLILLTYSLSFLFLFFISLFLFFIILFYLPFFFMLVF